MTETTKSCRVKRQLSVSFGGSLSDETNSPDVAGIGSGGVDAGEVGRDLTLFHGHPAPFDVCLGEASGNRVCYRIKLVDTRFSVAGSPYFSRPSAMLRMRNSIFSASVRIIWSPSRSSCASPGFLPWMPFQY